MLESGCVSVKNEVNIMMKNIVDIVLGGFTYWLFGYGMSFGRGPLTNPFIAIGDFLLGLQLFNNIHYLHIISEKFEIARDLQFQNNF